MLNLVEQKKASFPARLWVWNPSEPSWGRKNPYSERVLSRIWVWS